MRASRPSSTVDWLAVTSRWLILLGLTIGLVLSQSSDWLLIMLIGGLSLANLAAVIWLLSESPSPLLSFLSVGADFIFAHLLFPIQPTRPDLLWAGLLPLVTAGLYFRSLGAATIFVFNLLVQAGMLFQMDALGSALRIGLIVVPVYLLVAATAAWVGYRLNPTSLAQGPRITVSNRRQRNRQRAIYDLIAQLSTSLNYEHVLQASLDLAAQTLEDLGAPQADRLVGIVLLFAEEKPSRPELQVVYGRNLLASDRGKRLPGIGGLVARTIDEGEPRLARGLDRDAELSRLHSLQGCRSAYCVPLRAGLEAYGVLLFAHPQPNFFGDEWREILDIVGRHSVIALQNARLYRDLEQEKNRIAEIQEESRKQLARELHDGPTQSISAIAMRVNFARRLLERDAKAAAEELFKIEELARRTTKEIRHMLFTLRPLVLESQGLAAALTTMAEKVRDTYQQEVLVEVDPRVVRALETNKQAIVFALAEEAVTNARKHAQAAHIWLRLKGAGEDLSILEVEDDGVGFDPAELEETYASRGSLGMLNLRERADLLNGILRVESTPGRGTRVQVLIPLSEAAAERLHRIP